MNIKTFLIQNKKIILIQVFTAIFVVALSFLAMFSYLQNNAQKVLSFIAKNYENKIQDEQNRDISTEIKESATGDLPNVLNSFVTDESRMINLVKKADPAVVSIVVSKDVPIIEKYYTNPFGDLWGDNLFSLPQYRQNGTERKQVGAGSGFIVSKDGLVVTNRHVVSDESASYTLYTNEGKTYDVTVVARDSYLDLAILKIKDGSGDFPYLSFADSDALQLGQTVVAIGNALGEFRNSVSVGVVSGLSRSITAGDGQGNSEVLEMVIQTDAAINHGNSGGPLLDSRGLVIGVNVAVAEGSENIGFALPGNAIKSALESVKKTGQIIRPYLGVRYMQITKELKEKNNMPVDYGVIVSKGKTDSEPAIITGSPAEKAGIKENDIILTIDGERIDEKRSLSSIIQSKKVGDKIELKIMRKGSFITVYATLEKSNPK